MKNSRVLVYVLGALGTFCVQGGYAAYDYQELTWHEVMIGSLNCVGQKVVVRDPFGQEVATVDKVYTGVDNLGKLINPVVCSERGNLHIEGTNKILSEDSNFNPEVIVALTEKNILNTADKMTFEWSGRSYVTTCEDGLVKSLANEDKGSIISKSFGVSYSKDGTQNSEVREYAWECVNENGQVDEDQAKNSNIRVPIGGKLIKFDDEGVSNVQESEDIISVDLSRVERLLGLNVGEDLVGRMVNLEHTGVWINGITNGGYLKLPRKVRMRDNGVSIGYARQLNSAAKFLVFGEMHRVGLRGVVEHQTSGQGGLGLTIKQGALEYKLLVYGGLGRIKASGLAGNVVYSHQLAHNWELRPSLTLLGSYVRHDGHLQALGVEPGIAFAYRGAVDILGGVTGNLRISEHGLEIARWTTKYHLGFQGKLSKRVRWNLLGNLEHGNGFRWGIMGGVSVGF